jgi:hypothetical protein
MARPPADPTLIAMIRMHLSQDINRPVETVFDYFSDCRNETQWNPFVKTIDKIGDGPVGLDTRFRGDYPGVGSAEFAISVYEFPHRVGFQGAFAPMAFEMLATCRELFGGEATHFDFVGEFRPRGIFKLLSPLMAIKMRRDFAARGIALKRALESSPALPAI